METIYNKIDSLIDRIDSEFIRLWDCAENNLGYEYFDFWGAFEQLIQMLKQYELVKNYGDKLKEYYHVMIDLFETDEETIFSEYIDKNDQLKQVTIKKQIHKRNTVGFKEATNVLKFDGELNQLEYNQLYGNRSLEELNSNVKPHYRVLYSVLRGKCKQEPFDLEKSLEQWSDHIAIEKNNFKSVLHDLVLKNNDYVLLPLFGNETYKNYVKKLKKVHKYVGNKKSKFIDYLEHKDRPKLLAFLKKEFPSGKNKEAAIMVWGLKENNLISIPTVRGNLIKAIQNEWGESFNEENFNKPYREIERSKKSGFKGEVTEAIQKIASFKSCQLINN